jgi:acetyl-CoA decarbonylase/synthase complex subunit gamma
MMAKDYNVPLAVTAANLDEASEVCERAKAAGVDEIVINFDSEPMSKRIQDMTYARRMALKKGYRPLGYPMMSITASDDSDLELAEAVSYMAKYAGIVIMRNTDREFILPLLVARQDIFQDPQKPVQVEARVYEVGKVTRDSPVMVTTNFSITYFTVAGEVESSKVPAYIVCCDAEGMSVLTAWAAEKFTAEKISEMLEKCRIADMVSHRNIIIPGYVAVLSGKLEEVSGWKVVVGPREASGITAFLKNLK